MEARINRRSFVFGASCSLCGSVILPSCTQVPLTNRSQLNLYDSNLPICLLYTSPSPRDLSTSRMPSSA